jgi:hypothetical protein
MSKARNALLKSLRLLHRHVGAFTAPALIFFALSGALQTFNLHDAAKDGGYVPPKWVSALAQIHKKQTAVVAPKKSAAPVEKVAATPGPDRPTALPRNTMPMKMFFLLVAVGLLFSTVTGVYMSYKFSRDRLVTTIVLVAGVVVPVALLLNT